MIVAVVGLPEMAILIKMVVQEFHGVYYIFTLRKDGYQLHGHFHPVEVINCYVAV